jgi:hypothetical protein
MVSTSELTVVVDHVRFLFFFFASTVWVAAIEAAAWKADIFLASVVYAAARRPWMAPYATWREPRRHSPPSSRRRTRRQEVLVLLVRPQRRGPFNCAGSRHAVVPCTSRCPHGAENTRRSNSIRFNTKDVNSHRSYSERHQGRRHTGLEGLYTPSTLGHSLLQIRPPKMFFAPPWRPCTARPEWGRIAPSTRRLDGPDPGEVG